MGEGSSEDVWGEGTSCYSIHGVVVSDSWLTATEKEPERPPIRPLSRAACPAVESLQRARIPRPSVCRQMMSYLYDSGTNIESRIISLSLGLTKVFI